MIKKGYVYILFSKKNRTLYIGVTSDLVKRVYEHKSKFVESFIKKYNVDKLGYYEVFDNIELIIKREKQLKKYYWKPKLDLIEKTILIGMIYIMKLFNRLDFRALQENDNKIRLPRG